MDNAAPPVQPTPPPPNPAGNPRTWEMLCHLAALTAVLSFPFSNLIGPLIVWQLKKNEFSSVDEHGKESLNFQLSAAIYVLVAGLLAVVGFFFCIGFALIPVVIAIHYGAMIFAVIGAIKANDGVMYRYPFNLRLIR